jgi:hypothetical protein
MKNPNLPRIQTLWKRLFLDVFLSCLIFVGGLKRSRARVHWIGYHRRRARPERALIVLLFLTAMVLLEPLEYILWSIALGSAVAFFLLAVTVYRLVPRRRAHWVK